jgi:hypothetical protein
MKYRLELSFSIFLLGVAVFLMAYRDGFEGLKDVLLIAFGASIMAVFLWFLLKEDDD